MYYIYGIYLYCFSMIHSSKAYTVMNIEQQQPLIILNVGFVIWGNEWLSSWLSCQTGHLWLFDETWMDQVQKFKVKGVVLWKEYYSTLKECFKILIYKVTSYCEVSPSAGVKIKVKNRQVLLKLSWLTSFREPGFVSGPPWTVPLEFTEFIRKKQHSSLGINWPDTLLGTLYTLSLIQ